MYCYLCVHKCSPAGKGFSPEDSVSDILGEEYSIFNIASTVKLFWAGFNNNYPRMQLSKNIHK